MTLKRLMPFLPLVVLLALALVFALFSLHRDPNIKPDALVGQPMPTTAVTDPLSGPVPLNAAIKGPVIVNVFASWCTPCRAEHPELKALQAAGIPLAGIAYKDKPADTAAFLTELGNPFGVLVFDLEGRAGIDLGISGVPETYVVDARGVIVAKHTGPITAPDRERLLSVWAGLKGS